MGKRGPAPIAAEKRRTQRISVYLTADEASTLTQAAGGWRQLPAYLRNAGMRRYRNTPTIPEVNVQAWRELARTTANLNQLAYQLNAGGDVTLDEARAEVERLRAKLIGFQYDDEADDESQG